MPSPCHQVDHILQQTESLMHPDSIAFRRQSTNELIIGRKWHHFQKICSILYPKLDRDLIAIMDKTDTQRELLTQLDRLTVINKKGLYNALVTATDDTLTSISTRFHKAAQESNYDISDSSFSRVSDIALERRRIETAMKSTTVFDYERLKKLIKELITLRRKTQAFELLDRNFPSCDLIPINVIRQLWAANKIRNFWLAYHYLPPRDERTTISEEQTSTSMHGYLKLELSFTEINTLQGYLSHRVQELINSRLYRPVVTVRFSSSERFQLMGHLPCSGHITLIMRTHRLIVQVTIPRIIGKGTYKSVHPSYTFNFPLFPSPNTNCLAQAQPTVLSRSIVDFSNKTLTCSNVLISTLQHQALFRQLPPETKIAEPPRIKSFMVIHSSKTPKPLPIIEIEQKRYCTDLENVIKKGSVPRCPGSYTLTTITFPMLLKYIVDMASALEDCYNTNLIHRDVKPKNTFLDPDIAFVGDLDLLTYPHYSGKKDTYEYWDLSSQQGVYTAMCDYWGIIASLGCCIFGSHSFLPLTKDRQCIREEAKFNPFVIRFFQSKTRLILKNIAPYLRIDMQGITNISDAIQRIRDSLQSLNNEYILVLQEHFYNMEAIERLCNIIHRGAVLDFEFYQFIFSPEGKPLLDLLIHTSGSRATADQFEIIRQAMPPFFPSISSLKQDLQQILDDLNKKCDRTMVRAEHG